MDFEQVKSLHMEKIVNKHGYYQKWSNIRQIEYEVKYEGESYLTTEWIRSQQLQQLDQKLVDEYEKQFENMKITDPNKGRVCSQDESQESNSDSFNDESFIQDRKKQSIRKKSSTLRRSSQPKILRSINLTNQQNPFKILINTGIKKQQNHFIFGDRIQQILSECHYIYQRSQIISKQRNTSQQNNQSQLDVGTKKTQNEDKLFKIIQMNLGDIQNKQKDNQSDQELKLIQENKSQLLLKIGELNEMQKLKNNGVCIRIFLNVKWTDGTISKVKMDYLTQYEPQKMTQYRQSRKVYWSMWRKKNRDELKFKSMKQENCSKQGISTPKTSRSQSQSNMQSLQIPNQSHNDNNSIESTLMKKKTLIIDEILSQKQKQSTYNKFIRQNSLAQRKQLESTECIRKLNKIQALNEKNINLSSKNIDIKSSKFSIQTQKKIVQFLKQSKLEQRKAQVGKKSINHEALQQSRSKDLFKNYGIISSQYQPIHKSTNGNKQQIKTKRQPFIQSITQSINQQKNNFIASRQIKEIIQIDSD